METEPKIKKILFYSGGGYGFRSLPIWHLWEFCQNYPTILLAEKLDPLTEKIVRNKEFFPKLEEIIIVPYSANSLKSMVKNNKPLYEMAKKILREYRPDIVVTGGKNVYPFPLYLRRIAKRMDAKNVCPLGPQNFTAQEYALWAKLISLQLMEPKFLPLFLKLFLTNCKKRIGHLIYYWFLPLLVRELPFRKEPGCVLFGKNLGKSADYYIAFSKKDYDLCLKEGLPSEKLYILANPYPKNYQAVREAFKKEIGFARDKKSDNKILTWMYPDFETGIKKEGSAIIPKETMQKERARIMTLLTKYLPDWKIFIKPHPNTKPKDFNEIKSAFESKFQNVEAVNPSEWADAYTEISDAILGSPPASISIYTAALICPEKPIIFLDFQQELLGDAYKTLNGVEYVDREEKFINILQLIQKGEYCKTPKESGAEDRVGKEFTNFTELLKNLPI